MPIETKDIGSKVVLLMERDLLVCPKCKIDNRTDSDAIKLFKRGCCGRRHECMNCGFTAPLRIFIKGKLPSEEK